MVSIVSLLYKLFSKERVEAELEKFLEFDFFPRVGGGIGMTRMIAALDTLQEEASSWCRIKIFLGWWKWQTRTIVSRVP